MAAQFLAALPGMAVGAAQAAGAFDPNLRHIDPLEGMGEWMRVQEPMFAHQAGWQPALVDQAFGTLGRAGLYGSQLSEAELARTLGSFTTAAGQLPAIRAAAMPRRYRELLGDLVGAAGTDLEAGYQLSPEEQRFAEQQIYSQFGDTGWFGGNRPAMTAALRGFVEGSNLRQRRLQNAQSIAGLYGSTVANPFEVLPRLAPRAGAIAGGLYDMAMRNYVDPLGPAAQQTQQSNFMSDLYEEIAHEKNQLQGWNQVASFGMGGLMGGGGGGMFGGMMGGGGGGGASLPGINPSTISNFQSSPSERAAYLQNMYY